jgi:flagellar basal-body rod protein FlgF
MDRMIWLSMTGAKALLHRQDTLANNLANADATGFRADLAAFRAVPGRQEGTATTRVWALEATAGFDTKPGPVRQTGRPLDVAVSGPGWIAVQAVDGEEAYTRDGSLQVDAEGLLRTSRGQTVLGDSGPISIPPGGETAIGADGIVTVRLSGQPPFEIGRLKLVNPPASTLRKGEDGLVRTADRQPATPDPAVRLAERSLEGSNVNVVEAMVGLIALSRQFEMQMRMLQNAEQNEQRATQLLSRG